MWCGDSSPWSIELNHGVLAFGCDQLLKGGSRHNLDRAIVFLWGRLALDVLFQLPSLHHPRLDTSPAGREVSER